MYLIITIIIQAYLSWINPRNHTTQNSQVGKLKYCRANRHAEMDIFMDSNPQIRRHIRAMASTTSRRPFHFLQDPSVPCPTDHSYPGQPFSAMIHPDPNLITEVILDKMDEEKSDTDLDDVFDDEEEVEDTSIPDKSTSPAVPTPTMWANLFPSYLPFQQVKSNRTRYLHQ